MTRRRYAASELALLERYVDRPFPMRRHAELLPHRSRASIAQKLWAMRRDAGTVYTIPYHAYDWSDQ